MHFFWSISNAFLQRISRAFLSEKELHVIYYMDGRNLHFEDPREHLLLERMIPDAPRKKISQAQFFNVTGRRALPLNKAISLSVLTLNPMPYALCPQPYALNSKL